MAPITPYEQGIVGTFPKESKEFSSPRPDTSFGTALSGLGDLINTGFQGWADINKYEREREMLERFKKAQQDSVNEGMVLLDQATRAPTPAGTTLPAIRMPGTPGGPATGGTSTGLGNVGAGAIGGAGASGLPTLSYTDEGTTMAVPRREPVTVPATIETPPLDLVPGPGTAGIPAATAQGKPIPPGVLQGMARIDKMAQASRQGKFDDIAFTAELQAIVQDVTSKNPGFAVDIHQYAKSALGFDPLMAQRTAIQRTLEQVYGKQADAQKDWIRYVDSHEQYVPPELRAQALDPSVMSDPAKQTQFRILFGTFRFQEHHKSQAKQDIELAAARNKLDEEGAIAHFHKLVAPTVREIYTGATFALGNRRVGFENLRQTVDVIQQQYGGKLPKELQQDMANVLAQMERAIDTAGARVLSDPTLSPYFKSNSQIANIMDRYKIELNTIKQQIGADNLYLATNMLNSATGMKEMIMVEALKHPVYRDFYILSTVGGAAAPRLIEDYFKADQSQTKYTDALRALDTLNKMDLFTSNPARANNLYEFMQRHNIVAPTAGETREGRNARASFAVSQIQFPQQVLISPNAGDAERLAAARHLSDPANLNFIDMFNKDQRSQIWSTIYTPATIDAVQMVGTQNLPVWIQFTRTGDQIFRHIYNQNIGEIRKAIDDTGRTNLRWNEDTQQIDYTFTRRFQQPYRNPWIASSYVRPIGIDAKQAIDNFNVALKTYGHLLMRQDINLTADYLKEYLGIDFGLETIGGKGTTSTATTTPPTATAEAPAPLTPVPQVESAVTQGPAAAPAEAPVEQAIRERSTTPMEIPTGAPFAEEATRGRNIQQAPAQRAISGAVDTSGTIPMRGQRLPPEIRSKVLNFAEQAGLPEGFLDSVIHIESGGDPNRIKGSYKGLGQLSDAQFRKYGPKGGNIFNADDNLAATTNKFVDMANNFNRKYGRAPTATELYLAHQQGEGGLAAHMRNPDGLAWENMASTAEGRRKGDAWAKRAIWGNVPDDVKSQYDLNTMTSQDFMNMWGRKLLGGAMRRQGGGRQSSIPFEEGNTQLALDKLPDVPSPPIAPTNPFPTGPLGPFYNREVASDATDIPVAGQQYAMSARGPFERTDRPGRPSGEGGGGLSPGYQARETVEGAAVKTTDGRIVQGPSHAEIVLGLSSKDLRKAQDGFVTSSGRFISQEEAIAIVNRTGQPTTPRFNPNRRGLISEDLPTKPKQEEASEHPMDRGVVRFLKWLTGDTRTSQTTIENKTELRGLYPSNLDVDDSRRYDLSYGDPSAPYLTAGKASINTIPIQNVPAWFNKDIKRGVAQLPVDDELSDTLHRAWLASRNSAISQLGFDISKTHISPKSEERLTINGFYDPNKDQFWSDTKVEGNLVHESFHRGLEILREQGIKIPISRNAEEYLVRALMDKYFPDLEYSRPSAGRAAKEQIEVARRMKDQLPLDEIENLAAQYIAKKRPMGPR